MPGAATDYTCTPFFEEADCDYVLIPSVLCADEFVRRGIGWDKLVPLGIPVSAQFRCRMGKEESRRMLGDPERCRRMMAAQRSQIAADSADQIVAFLEEHVGRGKG